MPTRLVHVAIDAADPARLARFWAAALQWEAADDSSNAASAAPAGNGHPGSEALPLMFVRAAEPKTVKNRLHLDLATESAEGQRALVSRLLDLGARRVDIGQGDVPWVVMGDPEGNEFCVLEPRPVYSGVGPVAAIVMDSADPAALAGFWALAGGWVRSADRTDLVALRSPTGLGPYLEFLPTSDQRAGRNRVHLDVAPQRDDERALEADALLPADALLAVDALLAAGATRAEAGDDEVSWTQLLDPEGNEFCVLSPG